MRPAIELTFRGRLLDAAPRHVSADSLEKLMGEVFILTSAFRDETPQLFEGFPIARLADRFAFHPVDAVRLVSFDGYEQTFSLAQAKEWNCIIAVRANGQIIPRTQRGPMRVLCDVRGREAAETEVIYSKFVWQLSEIEFK